MFQKVKRIMSPEEIKRLTPLSADLVAIKQSRDKQAIDIITGKDKRKMVVIGPCSADNEDAVCDYVSRLAKLSEEVKDKLFVIPRIYTNKPRTKGEGYKGMLHSPDPNKGTDIQEGILQLRKMHIRTMRESGLSAADEMLYPNNYAYVDDLLTYVAIGARSTENQEHRLVGSGMNIPLGVKNPMNGSLGVLINSIYAAQLSNEFKFDDWQVKTDGNPYAHAVLRGSVDVHGNNIANYHYEDVMKLFELHSKNKLQNPAIIVDVKHSNSGKNSDEQI
ncbi:MAG: 3-deoxy-7-phosphoheptulonate synthase, partial [Firmicutes bacterium]|nr:3-deoxy-7-phosphoheptulonate synthase [Bacillota bacterium]